MKGSIATHLPVLATVPFASLNSSDAVMAEVLPAEEATVPSEEQLRAEYERGRRDGEKSAGEKSAAELEAERRDHANALNELTARLEQKQVANFAEALRSEFEALEIRMASSLADVLEPLLEKEISNRIVSSFRQSLAENLSGVDGPIVRVRGPKPLAELLQMDLGSLAGRVTVESGDQNELTATIGETFFETRFQEWMAQLKTAREA
jgi:hypothetical protein